MNMTNTSIIITAPYGRAYSVSSIKSACYVLSRLHRALTTKHRLFGESELRDMLEDAVTSYPDVLNGFTVELVPWGEPLTRYIDDVCLDIKQGKNTI
jgi:hypothetical protein